MHFALAPIRIARVLNGLSQPISLLAYVLLCFTSPHAFAQRNSDSQPIANGSNVKLAGVTLAPYSRPRAGRPLTVHLVVENETDQPGTAIAVAALDTQPDLQGTFEVHVPARESRVAPIQLQVPAALLSNKNITINVSLRAPEALDKVLLSSQGQPLIDSLTLPLDSDRWTTAAILAGEPPELPEWAWPRPAEDLSYEWIIAARVDTDQSRKTLTIDTHNLPAELVKWNSLDSLVIGVDWPFQDVAAMQSLRRWLAAGGRLWIMLDQVDDAGLRSLLPDGMSCKTIDDQDLNELMIATEEHVVLRDEDRMVVSETPIRFRRVTQSGGFVSHSINGYPAAIWYRVGQGNLLVTTLSAAAWLKPRMQQRSTDQLRMSNYQVNLWGQSLSERFFELGDTRPPLEIAEIEYHSKLIGNPVLDRRFVMSTVIVFCLLLSLACWICWWRSQMLALGWLVPLLSIAGSIPLLVASAWQRRDIPDATAHLQVIEVQPGSGAIQGRQWTATYSSQLHDAHLQANGDVTVGWPATSGQTDMRRWSWHDFQKWELRSSSWPRGLWQLRSQFGIEPKPLDVEAQLDAEGVSLKMPAGLSQTLEDSVMQFVPGDPTICGGLEAGKSYRIAPSLLALGDSWLSSTIINDEQIRRDSLYRQSIARGNHIAYPTYPAVMGWTKLWPSGLQWQRNSASSSDTSATEQSRAATSNVENLGNDKPIMENRGAALVVLPVRLAVTPSGQEVTVPHSMISVTTFRGKNSYSTAFANHSGWWREETSLPSTVPIRFRLPEQVLPIEAQEITVHLKARAPQRRVRVLFDKASDAQSAPEWQTLHEATSPLGPITFRITDPSILSKLTDGTVELHLDVSEQLSSNDFFSGTIANWQVDYFRIDVHGRVADRTLPDRPLPERTQP